MMENYDRTMELVDLAQTSAGKSSEQFAKYQDTIENKLNKLKNSWEQLRVGFLNSEIYKKIIDQVTKLVDTLNNMNLAQLINFGTVAATLGTQFVVNFIKGVKSTHDAFSKLGSSIVESITEKINFNSDDRIRELFRITPEIDNSQLEQQIKDLNQQREVLEITPVEAGGEEERVRQIGEIREQIDGLNGQIAENNQANEESKKKWTEVKQAATSAFEQVTSVAGMATAMLIGGADAEDTMKTATITLGAQLAQTALNAAAEAIAWKLAERTRVTSTQEANAEILASNTATNAVIVAESGATGAAAGASLGSGINAGLSSTGVGLIIVGIATAIAGIAYGISALYNNYKENNKSIEDQIAESEEKIQELQSKASQYRDQADESKDNAQNVKELKEQYDKLSNKVIKTNEEQEQYNELVEKIKTDFPEIVTSYNEITGELKVQNDLWDNIIKKANVLATKDVTSANASDLLVLNEQEKNIDLQEKALDESPFQKILDEGTGVNSSNIYEVIDVALNRKNIQAQKESNLSSYLLTKNTDMSESVANFIAKASTQQGKPSGIWSERQFAAIFKGKYDIETKTFTGNNLDITGVNESYRNTLKQALETFSKEEIDNVDQFLEDNRHKGADIGKIYEMYAAGMEELLYEQTANQIEISTDEEKAIDDFYVKIDELTGDNLYDYIESFSENFDTNKEKAAAQQMAEEAKEQIKKVDDQVGSVIGGYSGIFYNWTTKQKSSFAAKAAENISAAEIIDTDNGTQKGREFNSALLSKTQDLGLSADQINQLIETVDFTQLTEVSKATYTDTLKQLLEEWGIQLADDTINTYMDAMQDAAETAGFNTYLNAIDIQQYGDKLKKTAELFSDAIPDLSDILTSDEGLLDITESKQTELKDKVQDLFDNIFEETGTKYNIDDYFSVDESGHILADTQKLNSLFVQNTTQLKEQFEAAQASTQQRLDELRSIENRTEEEEEELNTLEVEEQTYSGILDSLGDIDRINSNTLNSLKSQNEQLREMAALLQSTISSFKTIGVQYKEDNILSYSSIDSLTSLFEEFSDFQHQMSDYVNEDLHFDYENLNKDLSNYLDNKLAEAKAANNTEGILRYQSLINELNDSYKEISDTQSKDVVEAQQKQEESLKELEDAQKDLESAQKEVADAEKDLEEAHKKVTEAEEKLADENKKLDEAYEELTEKEQEVIDKEKALNEAYYGTGNRRKSSLDGLYNYITRLEQLKETADKAKESLDNLTINDDIGSSVEDYKKAIHDQVVWLAAENNRYNQAAQNSLEMFRGGATQRLQDLRNKGAINTTLDVSDFIQDINNRIVVNFDAINKANLPDDLKTWFEEQADTINTYRKNVESNLKELENVEKDFNEFRKNARSQQISLEQSVIDILKQQSEQEVENTKNKYDQMAQADSDYLSALEEAINKQRQLREQEEKWQNLGQQEKKLSLISRDTSGTQQKNIQKQRDEIEKTRNELLDNSVDNIVNSLKELYDQQKENRDLEIQYQEYLLENSNYIEEANAIITSWATADDMIEWFYNNNLEVQDMTQAQLEEYTEELEEMYTARGIYMETSMEDFVDCLNYEQDEINRVVEETSETLTSSAEESLNDIMDQVDEAQEEARQDLEDALQAVEDAKDKVIEATNSVAEALAGVQTAIDGVSTAESNLAQKQQDVRDAIAAVNAANLEATTSANNLATALEEAKKAAQTLIGIDTLSDINKEIEELVSKNMHGYVDEKNMIHITGAGNSGLRAAERIQQQDSTVKAFKTGGLVNYTGTAWVDGTPAKPEAFLNSDDTLRIGRAAELLATIPALQRPSNVTNSTVGDTHIEIHINVENVSSDYDVDQAVERVKQDIVDAANQVGSNVILYK